MATTERPAGSKRTGWRFHVPVCFQCRRHLSRSHHGNFGGRPHRSGEPQGRRLDSGRRADGAGRREPQRDFRVAPERLKDEREREAERQRHQEERRLDFEQYRSLQTELRETKSRAASLQAKIELTGALDRDRVGDALLLGFYFHRRNERLASSRESIFRTAAERLKLVTGNAHEIKLEKSALHEVLELTYGPIVAESFDLGYVLSHLGEDGLLEGRVEILSELERHLKSLRPNTRDGAVPDVPPEVTGLFRKLAGRVVSIVRRKA